MIIQEYKLIQLFEPKESGDKTAMHAFWVLHKGIIPHINNKSGEAFPGRKRLSTICKLSLPTIDLALDYLAEKKIINIKKTFDKVTKIHKTNRYSIDTCLIKTVSNLKVNESEESIEGVVNPVDQGSQPSLLGVVNPVDTNLQDEINLQDELTNQNFSTENLSPTTNQNSSTLLDIKSKLNYKQVLERKISDWKNFNLSPEEIQTLAIDNINHNQYKGQQVYFDKNRLLGILDKCKNFYINRLQEELNVSTEKKFKTYPKKDLTVRPKATLGDWLEREERFQPTKQPSPTSNPTTKNDTLIDLF